jgi:hypothetical protein
VGSSKREVEEAGQGEDVQVEATPLAIEAEPAPEVVAELALYPRVFDEDNIVTELLSDGSVRVVLKAGPGKGEKYLRPVQSATLRWDGAFWTKIAPAVKAKI